MYTPIELRNYYRLKVAENKKGFLCFKAANMSKFMFFALRLIQLFFIGASIFLIVNKSNIGLTIVFCCATLLVALAVFIVKRTLNKKVFFDKQKNIFLVLDDNFGFKPKKLSNITEIYIINTRINVKTPVVPSASSVAPARTLESLEEFYQVNLKLKNNKTYNVCTEKKYSNAQENAKLIADFLGITITKTSIEDES